MLPNQFKDALSYLESLVEGKVIFYNSILEDHWFRGWLSITGAAEYEAAVKSEWFDPHGDDFQYAIKEDEEFAFEDALVEAQMERSFRAGKDAAKDWVEYINSLHGRLG